jgi:hypothetical protein
MKKKLINLLAVSQGQFIPGKQSILDRLSMSFCPKKEKEKFDQ